MIEIILILCLSFLLLFAIYLSINIDNVHQQKEYFSTTVDAIDSLLPQTQCGKCHYSGCRPYAEAIALGEADINQCPPGGKTTIKAIAELMGKEVKPLSSELINDSVGIVALIDEDLCIGCVMCIKACPVDAIMGAKKFMHTVIKKYCTGCELCVPSCPVDCITMVPQRTKTREWVWSKPEPSSETTS